MTIKPATELNEFLQIHKLNYKIFVEEIPQHEKNSAHLLVDKFHSRNHYIIAKKAQEVIGMVCYNWDRPFSLDDKIEGLDSFLPPHKKLAEIRLLSVHIPERKPTVAYKLIQHLCKILIEEGTDAAVISGTTRQLKLYGSIGFKPFGAVVGTAEALYQPMYITLKDLRHDFTN